jgi:hypothetical protein
MKNAYKILVEKSDGKRPLERPKHRWKYNIKVYLESVECKAVDWIKLTSDAPSFDME